MTEAEITQGIETAAARLGVKTADAESYHVAGGEWDAETADELADQIVGSWGESARAREAEAASRHQ